MKKTITLSTAFGLVLCPFFVSSATVIHVPADKPTIQAGIDAAIAGDTDLVADGTYTGDGNRDIDFGGEGVGCLKRDMRILKSCDQISFPSERRLYCGVHTRVETNENLQSSAGLLQMDDLGCFQANCYQERTTFEDNGSLLSKWRVFFT